MVIIIYFVAIIDWFINIVYLFFQNQLFGKGKDTIYDAGARIKRALSPGRNMDFSYDMSPSCSPSSSPKVPRLSFDPEISDDEGDEVDDNYGGGQQANLAV